MCQDIKGLFKKDVIIVPKDIHSKDPGTVQCERLQTYAYPYGERTLSKSRYVSCERV